MKLVSHIGRLKCIIIMYIKGFFGQPEDLVSVRSARDFELLSKLWRAGRTREKVVKKLDAGLAKQRIAWEKLFRAILPTSKLLIPGGPYAGRNSIGWLTVNFRPLR